MPGWVMGTGEHAPAASKPSHAQLCFYCEYHYTISARAADRPRLVRPRSQRRHTMETRELRTARTL